MSELSRWKRKRVERECDKVIEAFVGDVLAGMGPLVCEHLGAGHQVSMHGDTSGRCIILRCDSCDADGSALAGAVGHVSQCREPGMGHSH